MITPEGIALPVTVASRGARAGALLLDFMLIGFLQIGTTIALAYIAGGTFGVFGTNDSSSSAASAIEFLIVLWLLAMFLFRNAYFLFFELGPRGATPGKRLLGIRVAARDGGRLGVDMVVARNLLRDIELFLPLVFVAGAGQSSSEAGLAATAWSLIFLLFPFFNRDRLRAGDIVAGSWVLEAPRRKLAPAMSVQTVTETGGTIAGPSYRFEDSELAVYGEYELQMLERVLREDRREALSAVHEAICRKIGRDPGESEPRPFLSDYYAQLRARLESGMRMGTRKADKFG